MRGWMRWNCETPLASSTAISPSSMACDAATWCGITASSGYWRSQRRPLRDCRRTSSWSTKAMARTPSHFTSKSQSSPRGRRSASVAFIGSMAAGMSAEPRALEAREVDAWVFFWRARAWRTRRGCADGARALGRRTARPHAVRRARGLALGLARRQVARDLFLRAAGEHAVGVAPPRPSPAAANSSRFLMISHSLPLPAALHVDQREIAVQLFAVQAEFQIAARQLLLRRDIAQHVERAAVPQHHAARAVVARRECCLRNRRTRGGDLPRAPRSASRPDRASAPSARPRISARHRSPAGSRNAAAWHRAAARRNNWPRRLLLLPAEGVPACSRTGVWRRTLREA